MSASLGRKEFIKSNVISSSGKLTSNPPSQKANRSRADITTPESRSFKSDNKNKSGSVVVQMSSKHINERVQDSKVPQKKKGNKIKSKVPKNYTLKAKDINGS